MSSFKQIAIIGSTASGKTDLAIKYAQKNNSNILSLDSLSIYKEIDIASAKPTIQERAGVKHFGIDILYPNEPFNVAIFIDLYKKAREESIKSGKNLVIVGGSSFYLKSLIDGISSIPDISKESIDKTQKLMLNLGDAYQFLYNIDKEYMKNIKPSDRYRIEKALNLYFETLLAPSDYIRANPPKSIINEPLPIYEIEVNRDKLREKIAKRTQKMLDIGLIDEVAYLEKKYTQAPNCMKAIGIREVLDYFNGIYTQRELKEKIIINTARLAKRQRTFNKSQFRDKIVLPLERLEEALFN